MLQSVALDILKTGVNVFLTGEPGSGKTHTINEYVKYLQIHDVESAITASTGIAATHISGMTIHSWSGIGIKESLDRKTLTNISTNKYTADRIRSAKVLVIDEISMLSADILDMVEAICRHVRQNERPFGGLQVIVVGDFFQLPPVVKKQTIEIKQKNLINEKRGQFAYEASAWKRADFKVCYLTEQYRQDDKIFLDLLSAIRRNNFDNKFLPHIQSRQVKNNQAPSWATKLFSYNFDVDRVNEDMLAKLPDAEKVFTMSGRGRVHLLEALKRSCLSPENLCLKVGAIVMFTKNNMRAGFVNGTLGKVVGFDDADNFPLIKTRAGAVIKAEPLEWMVEENGEPLAMVTQVPLRLAWAITVHKSQGMSLDTAVMDLSSVFEYGQGYVALSRVRRLSGLYLLGWNEKTFQVHPEVLEKDEFFRESANKLLIEFKKISAQEMNKMHDDFIVKCGGNKANIFKKIYKISKKNLGYKKTKGINSKVKKDTKIISYDLFKSGKIISEIAKIRGFTESTIENHLTFYIQNGQLKVTEIVPEDKIPSIVEVVKKYGQQPLAPLKEILGEEVSYGEIRAVISHLKYLDQA